MKQTIVLILIAGIAFAVVAAVMTQLMPAPLQESDYLVIGSIATLVAMLAIFIALVMTKLKSSDLFFKRRKKNE